jgi:hypothetical protein
MKKSPGTRSRRKLTTREQLAKGAATVAKVLQEVELRDRCVGGMRWSGTEDNIVRILYPDFDLLKSFLPHRTKSAVHCAAARLGLTKTVHVWTCAEVAILRKASRSGWNRQQILDALPHLNIRQIDGKFFALRLPRKRPPKSHGVPEIDAIRARAYQSNLTMKDLDEICGGVQYWRANCHRRLTWRHVAKAADYLGGQLKIEFDVDAN